MGKKVLVVGQGAREHALVWKLSQSPEIKKIYAAPGNPGIAQLAECVAVEATDVSSLLEFAKKADIDLTVVGPEAPLMEGIVDRFKEEGLKIFGPTAAAARLEGSKVFAKNLFKKYGIPTAKFEVFDEIEAARSYTRSYTRQGKPVVIKADGLAAGKGVIVAPGWEEASEAIDSIMKERKFGKAGEKVVIEECLTGEELSFFAITDGRNFLSLAGAQDHKRVFDNDEGPNTGGMGAYSNPPIYTQELHQQIVETIIKPVVAAMSQEGHPYQGVLYAGLMITADGPKVLEFNARFGDPEAQVILPMIKGDLLPILEAAAEGGLADCHVDIDRGSWVCVVLASRGYPGAYEKGKYIEGIDELAEDTLIFHAGTMIENGQLLTNGGRVLSVVVRGDTIEEALETVYREVGKIHFDGMHYRTDIGKKALKRGR
ncbi:MAG: phosphoribosylamine--glycine ligase [Syntrophomonadaceae bacterium]|nr:phosphoribosylamine--glycine ligase [Syntrophomonadaceae bacterium]